MDLRVNGRGLPMLHYTLRDIMDSRYITHIAAITNDPMFRSHALGFNIATIDEPEELAKDNVPVGGAIEYAVKFRERLLDISFDAVVIAEVSTPVRPPNIIDRCIDLLWSSGAEVVTTVEKADIHPPEWVVKKYEDGRIRFLTPEPPPLQRQQFEPLYHIGGACVVLRRSVIGAENYQMCDCAAVEYKRGECVYIDEPRDVAYAEFILERRANWKGKYDE